MFVYPKIYDVIVIGAGHAGIEAASAAARLGCETLILTQNLDSIGQMSCNPAIGGQAKGQMVREIDALGGVMGLNADATGIQFRMLNARKGPSVRSPRAQCDKKAYQFRAKAVLERTEHLDIKQGSVVRLLVAGDGVTGVETSFGLHYRGRAVVVTTGTFMRGLLHVGMQNQPGGRMGDGFSTFSDHLRELGFEVSRFKTGTPCRLNARSLNLAVCEPQHGDAPTLPFSFVPERLARDKHDIFSLNHWQNGVFHVEQVPCWITATNARTHDLIRANLHQSPLYAGRIAGVGPRYCPSIEDKVVKFPEKEHHQIFLEPEGRHTEEYYVNGISTSLPMEVQYAFIRSIRGLEQAEIMRPGYAVEYDFCPPTQLSKTLETKRVPRLYFAGQINGTSGYEEAAAQGLVAGANAALNILGKDPFSLSRADAYIGVLIDDLVTQGTTEPYRMFTSRAEHRLLLRHDNAHLRLAPIAHATGLIDRERWEKARHTTEDLARLRAFAETADYVGVKLAHWLKRPENTVERLPVSVRAKFHGDLWETVQIDLKYEGYIVRQEAAIERLREQEAKRIPGSLDYRSIAGLRLEARQKLEQIRPETLGQAARVSGVTPAEIALLAVFLRTARPSRVSAAETFGE
ncbi:MAG: tRNA uridine-5-carboxymethylaminomethyl(34) synthesis enzyme MnmG [Verrucomicrobiota bacterium]|nr:tRNA uridine-5-carboxymethylaminomethyl(34) synthesis enzyme MnmG [Verrucomicrobiota bacterium]